MASSLVSPHSIPMSVLKREELNAVLMQPCLHSRFCLLGLLPSSTILTLLYSTFPSPVLHIFLWHLPLSYISTVLVSLFCCHRPSINMTCFLYTFQPLVININRVCCSPYICNFTIICKIMYCTYLLFPAHPTRRRAAVLEIRESDNYNYHYCRPIRTPCTQRALVHLTKNRPCQPLQLFFSYRWRCILGRAM